MTRDQTRKSLRSSMLALALCALQLVSTNAIAREDSAFDGSDVVVYALTFLGTPYRYGGNEPATGFDCSGFVRYVVGRTLELQLPRRSEEIRKVGARTALADVRPGDLLFFNTLGQPWSHVAIALGDGQFIHAPARGGQIRIERLEAPYWKARFNGARRLDAAPSSPAPPAVTAKASSIPSPADDVIHNPRVTP